MTRAALAFLVMSWSVVLGLTVWSFAKILLGPKRQDAGGTHPRASDGVRRKR